MKAAADSLVVNWPRMHCDSQRRASDIHAADEPFITSLNSVEPEAWVVAPARLPAHQPAARLLFTKFSTEATFLGSNFQETSQPFKKKREQASQPESASRSRREGAEGAVRRHHRSRLRPRGPRHPTRWVLFQYLHNNRPRVKQLSRWNHTLQRSKRSRCESLPEPTSHTNRTHNRTHSFSARSACCLCACWNSLALARRSSPSDANSTCPAPAAPSRVRPRIRSPTGSCGPR